MGGGEKKSEREREKGENKGGINEGVGSRSKHQQYRPKSDGAGREAPAVKTNSAPTGRAGKTTGSRASTVA
jgi:hypothetical protein